MISPEPSAFDLEPATPNEIKGLENLANGLMAPVPAQVVRRYQLCGPRAVLEFCTTRFEEDTLTDTIAVLAIAHREDMGPRLQLAVGYDNAVTNLYTADPEAVDEVPSLTSELIGGAFDGDERDLIDFLESTALMLATDHADGEMEAWLKQVDRSNPLGPRIRGVVDRRARATVSTKKLEHHFDKATKLTIFQTLIDTDDEFQAELATKDVPTLQVQLEDEASSLSHCFSRLFSGIVTLDTFNPLMADIERLEGTLELGDEGAVINPNDFIPRRGSVRTISEHLCRIAFPMVEIPDDPAGLII